MRSESHSAKPDSCLAIDIVVPEAPVAIRPRLLPLLTSSRTDFSAGLSSPPRAAFTFALLNPETEAKLISGQMLDPSDWRSGSILWVVEMIMPYGQETGADMVRWLKAHLPDTVDRVRYLRTKRADRPAKVIEVRRIEGARWGTRVVTPKLTTEEHA